jgi:hypothetical protein
MRVLSAMQGHALIRVALVIGDIGRPSDEPM